jgi:hypothetical protein
MDITSTQPHFPFPPVVLTDYFSFADDIEMLVNHVEYSYGVAEKQYQWAKKYCSPEFVTAHLTRHINETV